MPYIYGQLIAAQAENKTSDYAATVTGAVWLRTDTDKLKIAKNSLVRDILVNDDKLVVGNNGTASLNIRLHRGANTVLQFVAGNDTTAEGTLSTSLAQISAKHENYTTAARPAAGNPGRLIWNTDLAKLQVDDSTTWQDVASGSGSGGGASGVESLAQKLENEKFGIITESLDNSVGISGYLGEPSRGFRGTLLKDHASAVSSLEVVWNALAVNSSDQNYDVTTNWTVQGSGASLTASSTAGDFQVGTAGLKFDKGASTTEATIRYDIGSQTMSLAGNTRVWVYVKLPSITDVTNIVFRVYADSTSNYQTFTASTDYAGSALAIGWNLMFFDISTGGSATGTGWDRTKLSRYPAEIGVTTGSAATTLTGICVDSLYYSASRPQDLGVIGNEFTLHNNSTKESVVATAANTRHDGPLALVAATSNAYNGGASGTARGRVLRNTMDATSNSVITMDNDSTLSGTITTAQELRYGTFSRATLSGDLDTLVDMTSVQSYEVTAVGGSTIDVADPSNQTANLVNGDTVDVFRPLRINGTTKYILRAALSLTAGSTHSSGTTTLTLTTTGIAVGDVVVKRAVTGVQHSVVAEAAAESFSAASLLSAPNGVQLIDEGLAYPNYEGVFGHYALGSFSQADAVRNRFPGGAGSGLVVTGTNNTGATFQRGRNALEGANPYTTHVGLPAASAGQINISSDKAQYSMWFYYNGVDGGSRRCILSQYTGGAGFYCIIIQGTSNITLTVNNTEVTMHTGLTVGWHHLVVVLNDSNNSYTYLDGVRSANHSQTTHPGTTAVDLGILSAYEGSLTYYGAGLLAADLIIWKNGATLSQAQVLAMSNGQGSFVPVGQGLRHRLRYQTTGVAGQKISTKVSVARTTTAVTPLIWKAGSIVT